MDVRSAIEQFIASPGDQSYGDDRQPLQRADDHARPAGNAVARAVNDASDLFRGVPIETGALARYVRTNFHSDSPNEAREQTSLIAALSIALERGPARPRAIDRDRRPQDGNFNADVEIDISRASSSPAPPLRSDPRVLQALVDVVERSPGRQWDGSVAPVENDQGVANRGTLDRFALTMQTYAMYTVVPLTMDDASARNWMRGCIATHFVGPEPYKGDPRLDAAAVERMVDELLAYAQRSVDPPS